MTMFKARYYKADGKKGRARDLPETLFDGVVNEPVLHQSVKAYLSNQRQGTASAKTRAEVSGGNSKPFKQKGTGRARQGSTRSPHMDGGGRAFPPQPHKWEQKLPRKVKALARRSALNSRAEADNVVVVDALEFEAPKTAQLRDYLGSIEAAEKVLVLTDGVKLNVYLSSRNLPNVKVMPFGEESAYDILWARTLVIERGAIDRLGGSAAAEETGE
ncbi:MAG: 50S ribosomal protein L4 [Gemmatimonadetes bacterium]|nr:50S ribosomal protein L4 [Gemmatimonadota bacterium]